MTLKEYGENAEIVYSLIVTVNDDRAVKIEAHSEESLLEQLHKVDNAIKLKLIEQYEDLPETIPEVISPDEFNSNGIYGNDNDWKD